MRWTFHLSPLFPFGGRLAGAKMGSGRPPTSMFLGWYEPVYKLGAGARPSRVTYCCFEHAGQNFGFLDRGPRAVHLSGMDRLEGKRSGARCKTKQKPVMVGPVEIPDAEHEWCSSGCAAIEWPRRRARCVCGCRASRGGEFSRVWDVPARTGAITELAEQLVEGGIERVTVESTSDYVRHEGAE